jgi:hypothetical protein
MLRRLGTTLVLALLATLSSSAAAEIVPVSRAGEFVGRQVTVEGRVVAAYDSPLATVLAFAPNFAGFTATILAGDRGKFPGDVEQRYRGRLVQLTGPVTAYRGKPEMRVRDPSQVSFVVDPNVSATPPASPTPAALATPHADVEELRRAVAILEDHVATLEARLAGAEQALAAQAAQTAWLERARGLDVGANAATVRATLGKPIVVQQGASGSEVWSYGTGKTVTFDVSGHVLSWTGF